VIYTFLHIQSGSRIQNSRIQDSRIQSNHNTQPYNMCHTDDEFWSTSRWHTTVVMRAAESTHTLLPGPSRKGKPRRTNPGLQQDVCVLPSRHMSPGSHERITTVSMTHVSKATQPRPFAWQQCHLPHGWTHGVRYTIYACIFLCWGSTPFMNKTKEWLEIPFVRISSITFVFDRLSLVILKQVRCDTRVMVQWFIQNMVWKRVTLSNRKVSISKDILRD
jgi:hypothetical protein